MNFVDIHTHQKVTSSNSIINCTIDEAEDFMQKFPQQRISVGLHPWYLDEESVSNLTNLQKIVQSEQVFSIGETGLDKICKTPFELQKEIFTAQIHLSEEAKKPLIIHCVKAFDEIIALKKELNPTQAWIIHGFRGKKELADQLVKKGLYLSFGKGIEHLTKTINIIPLDKLFFETDDLTVSITEIYEKAAQLLHLEVGFLAEQIEKNIRKLY